MKYYQFNADNGRNCKVKLFATKEIYEDIEKTALQQLFDAACLPEVKSVVGLPDIHQGYGLPIGGVMASEYNKGIISPGAVGFDINCGVRLLTTSIKLKKIENKIGKLINNFKKQIPAGLGKSSVYNFSHSKFTNLMEKGLPLLLQNKEFGKIDDISSCEDNGCLQKANMQKVSDKAVKRGIKQLGTLGSGNHFIEIQKIDKIYDSSMDLDPETVFIMVHTGSRGFGHQIAQDYINKAKSYNNRYDFDLPRKNLASFPVNSKEGNDYKQAMACAANFAFINRQLITSKIRKILHKKFTNVKIDLFYDQTHNIAKVEEHIIKNNSYKLMVHRKGASRLTSGGIALIPGSMGTGSYIVKSKNTKAATHSLNSVAHGAGRKMSRNQAKQTISSKKHHEKLKNIKVISGDNNSLMDESPFAYKNIDTVIDSLNKTGLAEPAVRLKPLAVLKG